MYNDAFLASGILPPCQVLTTNGKPTSLRMSPNSSVLLIDNTAPLVWLCISDGIAQVTATPWDVLPHAEKVPPTPMELFEERLSKIEISLAKLTEVHPYEPDAIDNE